MSSPPPGHGPEPDLTVVVLSWNTREHTLRALDAVPAAAAPHRALVICVDNASADGTIRAVRETLPGVRVVENERNLGFARGNDAALPHVRGRAVCFLNSDTVASPGSLANALDRLDADPALGIVGPRLVHPDGTPQRSAWPFPTTAAILHQYTPLGWIGVGARDRARIRGKRGAPVDARVVDYVSGACLVIRRTLLDRLAGFDPGYPFYFEDIDLAWRAGQLGARVVGPLEGPPVVHVGGVSSALAEGALRLPLLAGILRFQRRRLAPRRARAFSIAFKGGAFVRSLVEVMGGPAFTALRRLRGPAKRADRAAARVRAHVRFLERDVLRFLRS